MLNQFKNTQAPFVPQTALFDEQFMRDSSDMKGKAGLAAIFSL